jgi:helix-turn-helix protein
MLEHDRKRSGFTVGQVAWRLGVSPAEYRELVDGDVWPNFQTWDRMCKLYGWRRRAPPTQRCRPRLGEVYLQVLDDLGSLLTFLHDTDHSAAESRHG